MNKSTKLISIGSVVVAVLAIIVSAYALENAHKGGTKGALPIPVNFLPSMGVNTLSIGQKCGDQYSAGYVAGTDNCNDITSQRLAFAVNASTSVLCAMPLPAAPTEIEEASLYMASGTSLAGGTLGVYWGQNPNASTSNTLLYSTTTYTPTTFNSFVWNGGIGPQYAIGTTTATTSYLIWHIASTTAATNYNVSGTCTGTFQTIN